MYSIAARTSRGNEDHMARYFPLVMGKPALLWLDNLPAEYITSWATLEDHVWFEDRWMVASWCDE
jgi:hypothetical protein